MRNMVMLILAAVLSCVIVATQAPDIKETKKETKNEMKAVKKVHIMYEGDMANPVVKEVKMMEKGMKKEKTAKKAGGKP